MKLIKFVVGALLGSYIGASAVEAYREAEKDKKGAPWDGDIQKVPTAGLAVIVLVFNIVGDILDFSEEVLDTIDNIGHVGSRPLSPPKYRRTRPYRVS